MIATPLPHAALLQPPPPSLPSHGTQAALSLLRHDDLDLHLLNTWQRSFPIVASPFSEIAAGAGQDVGAVLSRLRRLQQGGSLSRIGGHFAASAGGAAVLAAMAVPAWRLASVAAVVSAHPGVNHNYERENTFNLWFVLTGHSAEAVECALQQLEAATDCRALRLPMVRPYRIDLGFDLVGGEPGVQSSAGPPALAVESARRARREMAPPAVGEDERPLAALVEQGLPLCERPYDLWAEHLQTSSKAVMATLTQWLGAGTLRRFGMVVRHHELGFAANAMAVFDVPDAEVDARGRALAQQAGVTLAYRRQRAPQWPYNLYCMVHGRDRPTVRAQLERLTAVCGLAYRPRDILFSRQRFKQTGARRFQDTDKACASWSASTIDA